MTGNLSGRGSFDRIELAWDCPGPASPVRVYELVLRADDLRR